MFLIQFSGYSLNPRKWLPNLKGGFPKNTTFATNQAARVRVALGSLVRILRQGKYFLHMNPVAMADALYFSLPVNDFDNFDTDETITQPQGYTTARSSFMNLPGLNSHALSLPSVEYTDPQPVAIEKFQPVVPATAMPLFDISTVTYPNVQGNFNVRRSLLFSNDELLAISGPVKSFYSNQAYSPSSSPVSHQPGSSNFISSDFHDPPSTIEPAASSSRQTLADVQPGLYHRAVDSSTSGVKAEAENDALITDLPLERHEKQSKNHRQQPYDKRQRGTRRREATPTIVPSNFDTAPAIAGFLTRQAIVCPLPIQGTPCGQSMNTAQEMSDHLIEVHDVSSKKSRTANVRLGGQCPHCGRILMSCIYRHLMSDFYRYVCPVEGCHLDYSRPDQLQKHCRSHGFRIPARSNEAFAVRK
jgi:hypothetical protein